MNRPYLKFTADYTTDVQIIAVNALLYHLTVNNNSGSAFWVQVWDAKAKTSLPSYPNFELQAPADNVVAFPFHRDGWQFGNGIYVRAVTASQGSTLIGGNNAKFSAQYDGPWPLTT